MNFWRRIGSMYNTSKRRRLFIGLLVMIFTNLYFIAQLFLGQNSIIYKKHLIAMQSEKQHLLSTLVHKNNLQQLEIDLINESMLDIDYLDEVARKKLNYSFKDEMVVIY